MVSVDTTTLTISAATGIPLKSPLRSATDEAPVAPPTTTAAIPAISMIAKISQRAPLVRKALRSSALIGPSFSMMTAGQALRPELMLAYLLWIGIIGFALNILLVFAQQRLFGRAALVGENR